MDLFYETNPELHLYCWDAGWYQIRKMLSLIKTNGESAKLVEEFQKKFSLFENRMREGVYEFRFLIK